MRGMSIAKRYAKGLIELAAEGRELDRLFANMIAMSEVSRESPHFIEALSDERVPLSKRMDAASRIAEELRLIKIARDTMLLLMQRGRVVLLPMVALSILQNIRSRRKLTVAHAQVSERGLADGVAARIEDIMSEVLGMTVECEVDVEPELIGGFVVEVGDVRYDASLRGKLTSMKEEFFSEERGA